MLKTVPILAVLIILAANQESKMHPHKLRPISCSFLAMIIASSGALMPASHHGNHKSIHPVRQRSPLWISPTVT